ncbi:hypothetical protein L518_1618 [Bordetella bronchiseptica MBORD675]|nr:hypothetical protein L576_2023 [Bordetella bronchiseptica OSU054]KCV21499.1 hypothetical protein AZ28_1253 [Bordetella pertussis B200]KCV58888.1 hypothetical protein AZ14_2024 [Bordetella bronchiseptica 980]KDB59824.1 hypothetical protein AZ16_1929 [Bordetella bronchiseptica B18-5 (C3)]KDB77956.1 hypothetical protein L495_1968 [Bordetella bronchiseptica CARE970018BB]KDC73319.1 hypothetical protein L512_1950 [Bordetella bronchiseptica MBORD624]KDC96155.1 hypothetical protein L518_1618 [Bord
MSGMPEKSRPGAGFFFEGGAGRGRRATISAIVSAQGMPV